LQIADAYNVSPRGSHIGSRSLSSDDSTNRSSSGTSSDAGSGGVTLGGFAHAFGSHFFGGS
jgi:hypothetical protein